MNKKLMIALLCLGLLATVYFSSHPTASVEEKICSRLSAQYGDCNEVILIDANTNLVFAENDLGIIPVLTNDRYTKIIHIINSLNYQEYQEENEPISWQASTYPQKNFSLISGFASDDAKTIILNSEGNIQPNKIFIRDNLWLWYATFNKEDISLPVKVTAYDANGQVIYGDNEVE